MKHTHMSQLYRKHQGVRFSLLALKDSPLWRRRQKTEEVFLLPRPAPGSPVGHNSTGSVCCRRPFSPGSSLNQTKHRSERDIIPSQHLQRWSGLISTHISEPSCWTSYRTKDYGRYNFLPKLLRPDFSRLLVISSCFVVSTNFNNACRRPVVSCSLVFVLIFVDAF